MPLGQKVPSVYALMSSRLRPSNSCRTSPGVLADERRRSVHPRAFSSA